MLCTGPERWSAHPGFPCACSGSHRRRCFDSIQETLRCLWLGCCAGSACAHCVRCGGSVHCRGAVLTRALQSNICYVSHTFKEDEQPHTVATRLCRAEVAVRQSPPNRTLSITWGHQAQVRHELQCHIQNNTTHHCSGIMEPCRCRTAAICQSCKRIWESSPNLMQCIYSFEEDLTCISMSACILPHVRGRAFRELLLECMHSDVGGATRQRQRCQPR